jgi:hypothetical protein
MAGLVDPDEAIRSGSVELEGDARAARDLPELFDLRDVMTRHAM